MQLDEVRQALGQVTLGNGWHACTPAQERALAAQLAREIEPGHTLHGCECTAVACHGACDAVLFFIAGPRPGLSMVRLTWQVPRTPGSFPWAERFDSIAAWTEHIARRATPPLT